MKNGATRQRLLKIADAVENWRTMRQDDAGVAVFVSTPGDAMRTSRAQS